MRGRPVGNKLFCSLAFVASLAPICGCASTTVKPPGAQKNWMERATSGVTLSTGHAYDGIIARNKAAFAEHPEYLGLVGGERKSTKLCVSNPGLRRLVIEDALTQLAKDPRPDSVSVDPSDGLGWCECEDCRAIGSVSDS